MNPVIQLVNVIYSRVMSGEVTLKKTALEDALSTSKKKLIRS